MLREFDPKGYIRESFEYYRRKPSQLRVEFLSGVTLALIEVGRFRSLSFWTWTVRPLRAGCKRSTENKGHPWSL